tara:strand:+ start:1549 stop:2421 length:873 start_codon:yes stop_codon:yes gene_type:complete
MTQEKIKIQIDYDTSKLSWLKSGGKISRFIVINSKEELFQIQSLNYFDRNKIISIGNFSNFLINDKGFDGIGIKLRGDFSKVSIKKDHILVGSGVLDFYFSQFCYRNKITGYEFLYTIPGSIGGNIFMNAGCYGHEIKDKLISLIYLDLENFNIYEAETENEKFNYRKGFQKENCIILFGKFKLNYGDQNDILKQMKEYEVLRNKSQPQRVNCCGSIFKNPPNQNAWSLIRSAVDESFYKGPIKLSLKHSNFFENEPNINSDLIINFIKKIKKRVLDKHQILLEEELKIL